MNASIAVLRFLIVFLTCLTASVVRAQFSGFTYQGRLERTGEPVTGLFDFEFRLFGQETGGEPIDFLSITRTAVGVTNGLFTTVVDFGPRFDGGTRFIEVSVRPAGTREPFVTLDPRHRVTAVPFATVAGSIVGTFPASQLPPEVVLETEDVRLAGAVTALNPGNRFAGDGSGLTGVLAEGLGNAGGVRFQDTFFRRLPDVRGEMLPGFTLRGVVAGDFNGDGSQDLMVSMAGYGVANLFTNTGNGSLRSAQVWVNGVSFGQRGAVTGDFNGDGRLDLATIESTRKLFQVHTNGGGAGMSLMTSLAFTNASALVALDMNADGLTDLAVTDGTPEAPRLRVFLSSGSGIVQAGALALPSPASDLIAGDVDGDSVAEVVVACRDAGQLRIYRSVGGVLELGAEVPAVRPMAVAIGSLLSFQASGLTYVSDAGFNGNVIEDPKVRTLVRTSGLAFQVDSRTLPLAGPYSTPLRLFIRDFNRDSRPDALVVDYHAVAVWQFRLFTSSLSAGFPRLSGDWQGPNAGDLVVADFDGDRWPDLGTASQLGAQVWLQDGSGVSTRSYAQFDAGLGVQGPLLADGGLEVTGRSQVQGLKVSGSMEVAGPVDGTLSFGSTTRQMLNLYGDGYALGVQPDTLYFRTGTGSFDSGFAWFRGGSHTNAQRNPGPEGTRMMTLAAEGLRVGAGGGTLVLGEPGNLLDPSIRFFRGTNRTADDVALINDRPGTLRLSGNGLVSGALSFGATTRQMLNLWGTDYGVGVQANSTYFRSGGDFMWFRRGQHSDAQGDAGAGGERLMRLTAEGRLGLGVNAPAHPIEVQASAAVARLTTTNGTFGSVLVLQNRTETPEHLGAINFETGTTTWGQIGYRADHQMTFRVNGTQRMVIDPAGNMAITGAYSQASDRNAKQQLTPIDPQAILDKVVALPLSEWSYRQDPGTRHVGPMAQDFHAAFGLGPDERHITTVDADGVALAAIQGLNRKLEASRRENAELRERLERLERLVESRNGR